MGGRGCPLRNVGMLALHPLLPFAANLRAVLSQSAASLTHPPMQGLASMCVCVCVKNKVVFAPFLSRSRVCTIQSSRFPPSCDSLNAALQLCHPPANSAFKPPRLHAAVARSRRPRCTVGFNAGSVCDGSLFFFSKISSRKAGGNI